MDFAISFLSNIQKDIRYSPWRAKGRNSLRADRRTVEALTMSRSLLSDPFGYVWYLGERVTAQYSMFPGVPNDPPASLFGLNHRQDLDHLERLFEESNISHDHLTDCSLDYKEFRNLRLAPRVVSHEVVTEFSLPPACIRVVDPTGLVRYEDIPQLEGPIPGWLPLHPDVKKIGRSEIEKLVRRAASTEKSVEDMANLLAMRAPAADAASAGGGNGGWTGMTSISRLIGIERAGMASTSVGGRGPGSEHRAGPIGGRE